MRIEEVKETKNDIKIITKQVVIIDENELKEILQAYAKKQGYEIENIQIETDYKIRTDEWNMNPHAQSYFKNIRAFIKRGIT